MSVNPINMRLPLNVEGKADPEVVEALQNHDDGINDLQQAIDLLKAQIDDLKAASSSSSTSTTKSTTTTITQNSIPGLGTRNDQTGQTSYKTQTSDNGALLIFDDASAVAVSLNSAVTTPYLLFVTNFGAGTATLTPSSGTINSGASFDLPQNYFTLVVFDGTNWTASVLLVIPFTKAAVPHQFFVSYDQTTGLFVSAQAAFTDISGIAAVAQGGTGTSSPALVAGTNITITGSWPNQTINASTAGFSGTIVTAQLTTLGAQGSMTFANGLLVSQVPAT